MLRWIASYPKSGNTLARLRQIAYEDPASFEINKRPAYFRQDTDPKIYRCISPVPLAELDEPEALGVRAAALVWFSRMGQKVHKGPMYLKTHCANLSINGTALIPPGLTESSLYIVRDPRDVAVSYADHLGKSIDSAIRYMSKDKYTLGRKKGPVQPVFSWDHNVRSWLTREMPWAQRAVRFEDMIADPEKELEAQLRHFGYLIDRKRLQAALDLTSFDKLRQAEDEDGFRTKSKSQKRFFRSGKVGGWRDVLTPAQVRKIEETMGEAMRLCGYEIEGFGA